MSPAFSSRSLRGRIAHPIRHPHPIPPFASPIKRFAIVLLLALLLPPVSALRAQESLTGMPSQDVFLKHQPAIESAVDRALRYLAANQSADGTFNDSYGRSVGVVSLVGMAYLSAGHLPGYGEFSPNLERCIRYVLESQRSNGLLDKGDSGHGLMYAHTIATLFLSECSGMVDAETQELLSPVLAKATKLILEAQAVPKNENHEGGWRYKPDSRD